jgi:hypothetical protein
VIIFMSQSPALRDGSSSADAAMTPVMPKIAAARLR